MKFAAPVFAAGVGLLLCGCQEPEVNRSSSTSGSAGRTASTTGLGSPIAVAILSPASGSHVRGEVQFFRDGNGIRVDAQLSGLMPGPHGFHIHEKGDCSAADASSAGGHFNPLGRPHGGPDSDARHAGDFGNLEADATGNARYSRTFSDLTMDGEGSFIGKAIIVHEKADDLKTQPSGDAGGRIGCGVIAKK